MIGKLFKTLRKSRGDLFTLDYLQDKTGVPKGHLSRIENNKVHPTHEMLLKVLMHGFDMKPSEAKNLIAEWKVEEALSQASDPKQVINNIVNGKDNTVITGGSHTIVTGRNNTVSK